MTVTLHKLTLSAQAVHKAGRKSYSLITNPPKCGTGQWTGVVTLTFQSEQIAHSLAIPCSR